jgi:hypothetical protein
LAPAALKAVEQWRYTPCRIEGELVEVKTVIEVTAYNGQ